MTNTERVLNYIVKHPSQYCCDDCLSEMLQIKPRQQINQICHKLESSKSIVREINQCSNCSKVKIINKFK